MRSSLEKPPGHPFVKPCANQPCANWTGGPASCLSWPTGIQLVASLADRPDARSAITGWKPVAGCPQLGQERGVALISSGRNPQHACRTMSLRYWGRMAADVGEVAGFLAFALDFPCEEAGDAGNDLSGFLTGGEEGQDGRLVFVSTVRAAATPCVTPKISTFSIQHSAAPKFVHGIGDVGAGREAAAEHDVLTGIGPSGPQAGRRRPQNRTSSINAANSALLPHAEHRACHVGIGPNGFTTTPFLENMMPACVGGSVPGLPLELAAATGIRASMAGVLALFPRSADLVGHPGLERLGGLDGIGLRVPDHFAAGLDGEQREVAEGV